MITNSKLQAYFQEFPGLEALFNTELKFAMGSQLDFQERGTIKVSRMDRQLLGAPMGFESVGLFSRSFNRCYGVTVTGVNVDTVGPSITLVPTISFMRREYASHETVGDMVWRGRFDFLVVHSFSNRGPNKGEVVTIVRPPRCYKTFESFAQFVMGELREEIRKEDEA